MQHVPRTHCRSISYRPDSRTSSVPLEYILGFLHRRLQVLRRIGECKVDRPDITKSQPID